MKTLKTVLIVGVLFLAAAALRGLCIAQEAREDALCLKCHDQWGANDKHQHPLIKKGKCLSCHTDYDFNTHRERSKPEDQVCMDCHSGSQLGRSHPIGANFIDPNTGKPMTCVSTCHKAHGTDFKYFVPYKNNMDLCLSCHKNM